MILLPNGTVASVNLQKQWKCLEVTDKAGKKILIKDFAYDPRIHSDPREVPKPRMGSFQSTPIFIPEDIVKKDELPNIKITPQERLGFLKSKGWKNLDKAERENYKELKSKYEPNAKESP